jgi:hypothetical protein
MQLVSWSNLKMTPTQHESKKITPARVATTMEAGHLLVMQPIVT